MLRVKHCNIIKIQALLARLGLTIKVSDNDEKIPGSFWGDDEAGLIKHSLFVRNNTPIHSLLHETCHYICMDSTRRNALNTNAGGDYNEENAVCYLQIILAEHIDEMGQQRMLNNMDTWGYSFRLGSAQQWFEHDATDAQQWLRLNKLINQSDEYLFSLNLSMK